MGERGLSIALLTAHRIRCDHYIARLQLWVECDLKKANHHLFPCLVSPAHFGCGKSPAWTRTFDHAYRLPPIQDDDDENLLAEKILRDHGLLGRYRADFDEDGNLVVNRAKLSGNVRLTYYPAQSRVVGEEQHVRWDQLLTSAHFRAGFEYPFFLELLWGSLIDVLVFSSLLWIASGIYLWWQLKRLRTWGWVSLTAGVVTFTLLALGL